ncbi:MAG: helix-turn-helix transcriptional regulator [Christensenellaceae bacterium]|nr:helix-turn-helix transcriptional regulator [Christensenellaceae bacterium]
MIGENILKLRRRMGLSQEGVAEKVGVSRQTVAKWEGGASQPDVEKCAALARLFGVSMDDLVNYSEEQEGMPIPLRGKHMFGVLTVGEKGQIVIPVKARRIFDIKPGDQLVLLGDEASGLAILKAEAMVKLAQQLGILQQEAGKK